MNKIIVLMSLLLILISVNVGAIETENKCYNLNLNYSFGKIGVESISVEPCLGFETTKSNIDYKAVIVSSVEEILDSTFFEIPLFITADEIDFNTGKFVGGETQLNETNVFLRLPYFKNGKLINIYTPNNTKILEINVFHFSELCGNNICEPQERFEDCPQDCKSRPVVISDSSEEVFTIENLTNQSNGENLQDNKNKEISSSNYLIYLILVIGLVVLIGIIWFVVRYFMNRKLIERKVLVKEN